MRKSKYYFTVLISLSALLIGFMLGYIFSGSLLEKPEGNEALAALQDSEVESAYINNDNENATNINAVLISQPTSPPPQPNVINITEEERVSSGTKVIYEKYYTRSGETETDTKPPEEIFIGKTKNELKQLLNEWDIIKFSSSEIIARQEINGETAESKAGENYIIGVYNGYIAVYYDKPTGGNLQLKEITDRHISALSKNEAEKLENGIHVSGNDELFKLLQDYGS